MPPIDLFSIEEMTYIRYFFEGVDFEVSRLLSDFPETSEENLTFFLGQLLDENSNFHQNLLSYKLSDLNKDLYRSDRKHLDITFETHEHKRHFEGQSKADLGIILEMNDYDGKKIIKGMLIQSKRLKYDLNFNFKSQYGLNQKIKVNGKEIDQFDYIQKKEKDMGVKYFYLLYNPLLRSFEQNRDRSTIIKYEIFKEYLHIRPGIKAADTKFLEKIRKRKNNETLTLGDVYEEKHKDIPSFFVSFSTFIEHFLYCDIGIKKNDNEEYINICRGYGEKDTVEHTLNLKISDIKSENCNDTNCNNIN